MSVLESSLRTKTLESLQTKYGDWALEIFGAVWEEAMVRIDRGSSEFVIAITFFEAGIPYQLAKEMSLEIYNQLAVLSQLKRAA